MNTYKCGCSIKFSEGRWIIGEFCREHTPNWSKKADKLIKKNESLKKRNKRNEFELKKRAKRRNK